MQPKTRKTKPKHSNTKKQKKRPKQPNTKKHATNTTRRKGRPTTAKGGNPANTRKTTLVTRLMQMQYDVAEQQAVVLAAPEDVDIGLKTLRKLAKLRLELDKECAKVRHSMECRKSGCHWSTQALRCTGSESWTTPSLVTADQLYRRLDALANLPVSQLTRNNKLEIYYHDEYIKDLGISVDRLHQMLKRGNVSRDTLLSSVTEIVESYPVVLLIRLNTAVAKLISPAVKLIVRRFLDLLREAALFGLDQMKSGLWNLSRAAMRIPGKVATLGLELATTGMTKPYVSTTALVPRPGPVSNAATPTHQQCDWYKQTLLDLKRNVPADELSKGGFNDWEHVIREPCRLDKSKRLKHIVRNCHPDKLYGHTESCRKSATEYLQSIDCD